MLEGSAPREREEVKIQSESSVLTFTVEHVFAVEEIAEQSRTVIAVEASGRKSEEACSSS